MYSDGTMDACLDCPSRQVPNDYRTACFCQPGTYDVTIYGRVTCEGIGEDDLAGDQCLKCPNCVQCDTVVTELKPGWAFYGQGEAYECPVETGCPGGELDNQTAVALVWERSGQEYYTEDALRTQCETGYTGPICGSCTPDFNHLKVGKPCESCDDGTVNVAMLLVLVVALLVGGAIAASSLIGVMRDHGIVTDARLIIGFYQIVSQMSAVLYLELPSPVPALTDLMAILFLDVRNIIKLDCWDIGGFCEWLHL